MHDLLVALCFIAMVVAPAVIAFREDIGKATAKKTGHA